MTEESLIHDNRAWLAFDFLVSGWDFAFAFHHYQDGEMLSALLMLTLGIALFVCGVYMATTVEET